MTRFTNWKSNEKEFVLQHVVKTPSDSSFMCKKCKLEAKRHHDTHHYIPKWKRHFAATPKHTRKCIYSQCLATEKLIHASFEKTENLEAALGITSSPDNPLLLCRDHYNEAYRKFHPQTVCASCVAILKSKTSFSRHSPDADFVSLHLRDRLGSNYTVKSTDHLCSSCYELHLSVMKVTGAITRFYLAEQHVFGNGNIKTRVQMNLPKQYWKLFCIYLSTCSIKNLSYCRTSVMFFLRLLVSHIMVA